jgi:hypothetical protein
MNFKNTNINTKNIYSHKCSSPLCKEQGCNPDEICSVYKTYINDIRIKSNSIINSQDLSHFNISRSDKIMIEALNGRY